MKKVLFSVLTVLFLITLTLNYDFFVSILNNEPFFITFFLLGVTVLYLAVRVINRNRSGISTNKVNFRNSARSFGVALKWSAITWFVVTFIIFAYELVVYKELGFAFIIPLVGLIPAIFVFIYVFIHAWLYGSLVSQKNYLLASTIITLSLIAIFLIFGLE